MKILQNLLYNTKLIPVILLLLQKELNNKRILKKGEYEKHHIIPKSLGGSNSKSNLIKSSM